MPDSHYNNYYGSILDPIHGDIKLSEIEKWILAQPIFSRLRRVKQNTFLYYVFPSSNHTRFEHSIGVMHVASEIYKACKENYATGEKKAEKFLLEKNAPFFNLTDLGEERETTYFQELRLAALLHDIGHGPMSHLFDSFAISKDVFLDIVKNDSVFCDYLSGFEKLINNVGKVEHEAISCLFIFSLIDQLKKANINDTYKFPVSVQEIINNISAGRIVKMIEPTFEGIENISDENKRDYTPFFSRIITAFPIDADRMDYLLRDSYFSGVTYGIYDINRIFSSFIPVIDDNKIKLGYKESGSDSMLRFIQSRAHLFNQVYFHKTNRGANTMLEHGTISIKSKKLLDNCKTTEDLINFYIINGDEYFLSNTLKSQTKGIEQEILSELIHRKLFKRIYRQRITIDLNNKKQSDKKTKKIDTIVTKINKKLSALNSKKSGGGTILIYAAVDKSKNENYKDCATDKTVLLIKEDNNDGFKISDNWMNQSLEFKYLNLATFTIRVYIKRSFHNPNDYNKIKNIVMQEINAEIKNLELLCNSI